MSSVGLVLANLRWKPTRTVLTFLSLVIAFVLFMLLRAISTAFTGGTTVAGVQRVMLDAKYSMTDNLPIAHINAIRMMPEVAAITQMSWFGGYYQDPKNEFAKAPVDHQTFFTVFPELLVEKDVLERFAESKRAVVVETGIAQRFGWQTGDVIPIKGDIWPKQDGSWDWEFVLAGTYTVPIDSRIQPWFLLRYDYFNESVMDWVKDQVGWAVVRVVDEIDPQQLIQTIDGQFEMSSDPTKSLSEDDYARQFASQLGDMALIATMILGAVFFTILLLTANVASLSFNERIVDLAVIKTLGFGNHYVGLLVLSEAMTLCVLGALTGVAISYGLEPLLQQNLVPIVGNFQMYLWDAVLALALAVAIGVVIGVHPAAAAVYLPIVEALREGQ
ncbi:MAG: ABC transporter permease [Gammaproteobacteria bacterium]|nr:ABC transporter permease [Gammaproteobacteria bacterium]